MELISKNLNDCLDRLIGKSFAINRMLDRGMSLLKVRWKMINSSNHLHGMLAHAYLGDKFADSISDYQSERGMESIYPATPIGNREYSSPLDFFNDYMSENIEFEDMIKDAINIATQEEDYTTKKFLDGLLYRLAPYIAASNDLVDLVSACDNDKFKLLVLDSEIDDYINV